MTDINAAPARGENYISDWDEGAFPYGKPVNCPFCKAEIRYTEFEYNGHGPPPSYMVMCGTCGATGPHSCGRERDDHFGAREDAVRQWNRCEERAAPTPSSDAAPLCVHCDHFIGMNMQRTCVFYAAWSPTLGWQAKPRDADFERAPRWLGFGKNRCGPEGRHFKPNRGLGTPPWPRK